MQKYLESFINSFQGTLNWTWKSIIFDVPWYTNYFWGLIAMFTSRLAAGNCIPMEKRASNFQERFLVGHFFTCFSTFSFLQL